MATRAAIYARISEDAAGEAKGVARQLEDARALAQSRGWEVVGEYTDNDISAFSGARRPGYQALMAAVDEREVDRIVVYMTSRLWRSRKERAADVERLERARVGVVAVSGPDLDLSTASGRLIANVLGEFDTMESAVKSERVARAAEQRATEGRPSGDLGYGWRRITELDEKGSAKTVGYELDPEEAPVVREVVDRLIAGDTLVAVAEDLTARGLPSPGAEHRRRYRRPDNPTGEKWGMSGIRKLALRPSNAGLRVHRGQVVGHGTWPAIITEDKLTAVAAVLEDPSRQTNGGNAVRQHLLSFGIGRCGVCRSRLRVATRGGNRLYVCDTSRGCVGRRQEWVDALTEATVVARLKRPDAVELLVPESAPGVDAAALERLRDLQERLEKAAVMYVEEAITAEQMAVITKRLTPEIAAAEKDARPAGTRALPKELRKVVGSPRAAQLWKKLTVLQKRVLMEAMTTTVTINKTRQGPGFEPKDVKVRFGKDEEEAGVS